MSAIAKRLLILALLCGCSFAQVNSSPGVTGGQSSGAGNGVTSVTFTGDGVVDSSTPSAAVTATGTLTATPATVSAHIFAGNNTGSSGNMAQSLIGTSDTSPNWYAADTGAVNAYVVTLSPAMTTYATGVMGCFKAANANTTTTPTVNFNGLGAKTITKTGGVALTSGDINTTTQTCVVYDGTNFDLITPSSSTGTGSLVYSSAPSFANKIQLGGNLLVSTTMPTVASGCGTSPTITGGTTAAFALNVGTGTITNPCVLTFTAAPHAWSVNCTDSTTISTSNFVTLAKGTSTTSVTLTSYTDAATSSGANWTASDVLQCTAFPY